MSGGRCDREGGPWCARWSRGTHRNQVWQFDFSLFETLGGGTWLSAEVVERLAEWEHRRSFSQHRCAGYTSAAATDHSRREHAMLVSYAELTEEQRELDRSAVRSIPHLLAAVGLATAPLETAHTPTTGSPTDADHSDLRLIDLPRLPQRA